MPDAASPPPPRPAIASLQDVAHGALDFSELEQRRLAPDAILDFSTNANPYGPPAAVRAALETARIDRYPDRDALALRRALAAHLNYPFEGLLPANGSAEILWLIALAYLEPGDRALIVGPTFGEYARCVGMMGARIDEVRASAEREFRLDPQAVTDRLAQSPARLAFICNPNNPTGRLLPVEFLVGWAAANPQTLFVIDEAYVAFAADAEASVIGCGAPNLLAVRSMTKDYALSGLRLGYAAGHPGVIAALRRAQPPWSVNAMAQAAGVAALAADEEVRLALAALRGEQARLAAALRARGFAPLPTDTQFFLLPVGDAARFRAGLLAQGVQVRDCASFGLPGHVRIAARTPAENDRLLHAIDHSTP